MVVCYDAILKNHKPLSSSFISDEAAKMVSFPEEKGETTFCVPSKFRN